MGKKGRIQMPSLTKVGPTLPVKRKRNQRFWKLKKITTMMMIGKFCLHPIKKTKMGTKFLCQTKKEAKILEKTMSPEVVVTAVHPLVLETSLLVFPPKSRKKEGVIEVERCFKITTFEPVTVDCCCLQHTQTFKIRF